ncbi:hypothetical protein ABC974_19035 [Sphingomonas oligophenolica]|uniref:Uncharacterized protein n=1 Tax=Sphingomonas oligophenolica TaxID=301154 RepID=A0ABU9Y7E0_9SPHN
MIDMPSLTTDAFLYLVLFAMISFIVGCGLISFIERNTGRPTKRD